MQQTAQLQARTVPARPLGGVGRFRRPQRTGWMCCLPPVSPGVSQFRAQLPHPAPSAPPLRGAAQAAQSSASSSQPQDRVAQLVQEGASLHSSGASGEELAAAVKYLTASSASSRPGPESLTAGQGTWEVFHAPHIARLSSALGARFHPIRYTLRGEELISNVCYSHPLLGSGWLSASGTLSAPDDTTLLIHFDQFWWDLGEGALRPELPPRGGSSSSPGSASASSSSSSSRGSSSSGQPGGSNSGSGGWLDAVVGAVGRAAFLPQFARFPVEALDAERGLAVFSFPPLASSIAVARLD